MTDYTRPATWDDVKQLARLLNEAGVEYALVGGYAIAAHGFNRFSEDIDILVNPAPENSQRWVIAFEQLPDHATRELLSNPDVFASDTRSAVAPSESRRSPQDQARRSSKGSNGCSAAAPGACGNKK